MPSSVQMGIIQSSQGLKVGQKTEKGQICCLLELEHPTALCLGYQRSRSLGLQTAELVQLAPWF